MATKYKTTPREKQIIKLMEMVIDINIVMILMTLHIAM